MRGTAVTGRRAAMLLALALLLLGVTTALQAGPAPLIDRVHLWWPLMIPVYLAASRLNLEFERRESSFGVTLGQLPLAVGVVLVDPAQHLVARLVAAGLLSAARRHDPLKATFNLGVAGMEVGLAAVTVAAVGPTAEPGPRLWLAMLAGLLAVEGLSCLSMHAVFRLLGMQVTLQQLREHLAIAVVTAAVFTGLAVLTISSALTDRSTLLVVPLVGGALAAAYRAHRRLSASQQATEELYEFVKSLGPVDIEHADALQTLQRLRELLHAEHLELDAVDASGRISRRLAVHLEQEAESCPLADAPQAPRGQHLHHDCMRTPLLTGSSVVGLLAVRDRIGTDRGFDLRDLRLLETVATELSIALDRGHLLRRLRRAATTDPLTELPNLSRVSQDLDDLLGHGEPATVLAVAVDSFREVNDTLGHQVGDDLLREVGLRLREFAGDAVLGRLGGGRFAVAVPTTGRAEDRAMYGLQLRTQVEGEAQLGVVSTHVRLSVGCARFPEDGADAVTLLRRAQTAMHSARRAHGGPVLWEPAYEVEGQRRLAVVMALREALAAGAIGVAFQPKVTAGSRRCTGVEALARWEHPALGRIGPDEFVPLAEASGLLGLLTSTVLHQSLTACRDWQSHGGAVGVAVNVSADTLQDPRFVTEVAAVLASVGVAPGLLTLELTENVVVADPQVAAERMQELRALGVRLSVDDFGTGYSSLTYLKGLPIDEVKIDKGFVAGLAQEPGDQAVVRAVVDIAHTLDMRVVAEGVEQEAQHLLLERLGVDEVQGYLHAKPMPAAEMDGWLGRRAALHARSQRP